MNNKNVNFESFSTRERILAAALKLFVDQGYFNTNIPDLSRESKCSVGSIYHCFKNKEEVANALYAEGLKAIRQTIENSVKDQNDIEQIIKTIVKSFLAFSEMNTHLSKYIWLCRHNEFMTGIIKHPTRIGFDTFGRKISREIKKAIADGKIRDLKANIIWTVLFGIPLSYVRDWLDGYNSDPPKQVANELSDTCWRALAK